MGADASRAAEVRSGVRIEVFTMVYERYQDGCQSFDSVAANWWNHLTEWRGYFSLVETAKDLR